MSCSVLLDDNAKPKSTSRAKQWTGEIENLYRFQQAGYRDELEYRQVKQAQWSSKQSSSHFGFHHLHVKTCSLTVQLTALGEVQSAVVCTATGIFELSGGSREKKAWFGEKASQNRRTKEVH
ncbi:hypothetical protein cypCar_00014055 [Cyprinus carpio]|nr:hypothetical protein cypCar_00014055 [Cyprinus carpio]